MLIEQVFEYGLGQKIEVGVAARAGRTNVAESSVSVDVNTKAESRAGYGDRPSAASCLLARAGPGRLAGVAQARERRTQARARGHVELLGRFEQA